MVGAQFLEKVDESISGGDANGRGGVANACSVYNHTPSKQELNHL
jgi:hypothetical protein